MAILTQKKLFTVEEYYRMAEVGILQPDDRVELIHGEIISMSPIKSFHSSIVDELHDILLLLLRGQAIIKGQNPLRLDEFSEPEPDLTIAKFRAHKYRHQHPRPEDVYFLIEVADSTLQKDRKIKLPLYAEAAIPEVWIVNLKNSTVEVYTNPQEGGYQNNQIVGSGEKITCLSLGFELEVDRIFG